MTQRLSTAQTLTVTERASREAYHFWRWTPRTVREARSIKLASTARKPLSACGGVGQ
ncbi:hypothetical protein ACCAA_60007 [Candidatus Accumulibacter aalborgensis]|uniref:Uncharacterized protein n=1 Tax=Candidatus Accumulibacter aalborgensis TaxID=1860102 RepID=A0A1A8XV58_9PROT|nr:hypothetical protein ACCAA_60007 [Candidatus Accumulibacter aalborgensis]